MTLHALERIAMRMPGLDPQRALDSIVAAHRRRELPLVSPSIMPSRQFYHWRAPGGQNLFPLIENSGAVITVLTEGMEAETPTGRAVLVGPEDAVPAASAAPRLAPGVHSLDADTYHADPAPMPSLSSTLARLILSRSPLHAWTAHPRLNPAHESKDSKTFDIGRAAHRAILGKGGDYVAIPADLLSDDGGVRTGAAKQWVAEARASGLTPLKPWEADEIGFIADAVRAKLALMRIALDADRSELAAIAEVDGVWCRAMVDNAPLDPRLPLYDIKTTTDASPDGALSAVVNYGYDVQAAFYLDAWRAATGEARRFRFIFVEKAPPFEVSVVELYDHEAMVAAGRAKDGDEQSLASDWMIHARSKAREARRIWGECLAAGQWPGYPAQVAMIGQPGWHGAKWEAREIGQPVIKKPSADSLRAAAQFQAPERKSA